MYVVPIGIYISNRQLRVKNKKYQNKYRFDLKSIFQKILSLIHSISIYLMSRKTIPSIPFFAPLPLGGGKARFPAPSL